MCDLPVLLPERDGLLTGVDGVDYPDLHTLRLAAWRLSGDLSVGVEFRHMLQTRSALPTDRLREICLTPSGSGFVAGAVDGVRSPSPVYSNSVRLPPASPVARAEALHSSDPHFRSQ